MFPVAPAQSTLVPAAPVRAARPAGEARTGRHLAGPDPRRRAPATSPG
jgi:hypothetical protein